MNLYQSHRQRLAVAADDFGISSRANRNILHLITLGKIDRVAVMAHGSFSTNEIEELVRSGVKIDIHLDIRHELGNQSAQKRGSLVRIAGFLTKLLLGKLSSKKVRKDWQEQIKKFYEIFGKYPDGVNSHEHVHFFPPFFRIALELQKEFSIPYMRFGDSVFLKHHGMVALVLHWLRKINMGSCQKSGCVSSGSLVSLDWLEDVDAFLENLPEGTMEIVCHPEHAEDFVKIKKYF